MIILYGTLLVKKEDGNFLVKMRGGSKYSKIMHPSVSTFSKIETLLERYLVQRRIPGGNIIEVMCSQNLVFVKNAGMDQKWWRIENSSVAPLRVVSVTCVLWNSDRACSYFTFPLKR